MPSLTIAWEYLTGYAVATDPTTRDRAEWPPHPARVFMALAAAWFETEPTDEDDDDRDHWRAEGAALRWLETLGDPELFLPRTATGSGRSNVTFYVPVNDRAGPAAATLQACPAITRGKQPRSFPRTYVGPGSCLLRWEVADDAGSHRAALDRLCRKVTRLGHSSSLVAMRVADDAEALSAETIHLVPEELQAEFQARCPSGGMLDMLHDRFGEGPRQRHAFLTSQIAELETRKKSATGKGAREQKAAIDEQIQKLDSERSRIVPRPPVRPTIGPRTGYRGAERGPASSEVGGSLFDPDLLVLTHVDGPTLPVVSTIAITRALRDTIMSRGPQPVPDWVSGHGPDGQPLRDDQGHLALVPLPHVGHAHADGHLLGVALVFPRWVPRAERGRVLGELLVTDDLRPNLVTLRLGPPGEWVVRKRDWQERRQALQPEEWTAASTPPGATTWASVTPVVLDRFPRAERREPGQRQAWEDEVRDIIRESCSRIHLPDEPEVIEIGTTCWHEGSPRAIGKRRPLRGQPGSDRHADAALGDGFPPFPSRGTNAPRPQVHVRLWFSRPVIGPVILGAGRYLGYGLCKPWRSSRT